MRAPAAPPAAADDPAWLKCGDGCVTLEVLARPGAARRRIIGAEARGLVIAINAPPERGKANEELIALLAHGLKLARSSIAIVRGSGGRRKTIRIATDDPMRCAAQCVAIAGRAAIAGAKKRVRADD